MTIEEQTDIEGGYRQYAIEEYHPHVEPYYLPTSDEVELFEAAFASKIPVLLKGPTGCGKTRFVEYMAWKLGRPLTIVKDKGARWTRARRATSQALPLITVACHEDLTASDLVGRYLLEGEATRWIDGPLTRAVKAGAICYLDEVVEARKDTTVLIHPLTDHRRLLPIEKRGAGPGGARTASCWSSRTTRATRARSRTSSTARASASSRSSSTHPRKELEAKIIAHESGVSERHRAAISPSSARRCATCASTASARASARACWSTPAS